MKPFADVKTRIAALLASVGIAMLGSVAGLAVASLLSLAVGYMVGLVHLQWGDDIHVPQVVLLLALPLEAYLTVLTYRRNKIAALSFGIAAVLLTLVATGIATIMRLGDWWIN
ncbi:MAG: hypothetical protein P4L33_18835 [Capsulimonadaceae bacterium]|nr:hypothetical protein [Capsulimonadaceae bacterium]